MFLSNSGNQKLTKSGKPRKTYVSKEELAEETENKKVAGYVTKALSDVNLRLFIKDIKDMKQDVYVSQVDLFMEEATPQKFDGLMETRDIWCQCIQQQYEKYPIPATKEKPQSFSRNNNNINKFFGNDFGAHLYKFANVMAGYFSGTIIEYLELFWNKF